MPHAPTNGIVTFYEDSGAGSAVVLIHGHSTDLRLWDTQVGPLTDAGFRVVRYDVRGHGRSTVTERGYTWENYALDLRDLLDHLGIASASLVGLSMGGGIALAVAVMFPERVASLVLADSALPGFGYSDDFSQEVEELVAAVRAEGPRSVTVLRPWPRTS